MRLYIETMDAVLVDYELDGRVRFDGEEWLTPDTPGTPGDNKHFADRD